MSIASNFPAIKPSLNLDFANTKMLDSRVTFTRASTGTYYNGVTTAKAEENLLLYSQEFDNAAWTKSNCTVTPNTTTAPDGTNTADKLVSANAATDGRAFQTLTLTVNTHILSVYAKAAEFNWVALSYGGSDCWFNLSVGAVGQQDAGVVGTITSAGSGWYRCSMSFTGTGVAGTLRVYSTNADAVFSTGDGTSGIVIWGAQLEQRSSVTAYTATTTQAITNYIPVLLTAQSGVPRFDHNPTTDESLGLLIEESRTNLVTYSEQFDNAAWTKTGASVTANTAVSPDGTVTADSLIEDATLNAHRVSQTISVTSGVTYTISVFAKASTRTFVQLFFNSTEFGVNAFANFNLSTGVLGTVGSASTAVITSVGNGWYRCSMTAPATATGAASSGLIQIVTSSTAARNENYTGDGTSGLFLWGAQAEAGAFATSYIQTVAATVTRAADAASMTGTNFSSWFSAAEYTLYSEWDQSYVATGYDPYQLQFSDGTLNNRVVLLADATVEQLFVGVGGVTQTSISRSTVTANQMFKAAARVKTNDFAIVLNGGAAATDTSGTVPTVTQLALGQNIVSAGTKLLNGHLRRVAYYPMALSTANLQALTS